MMRLLCKPIVLMLTLNILRYLYAVPFSLRDSLFGEELFTTDALESRIN